jgi:hypothetical protein
MKQRTAVFLVFGMLPWSGLCAQQTAVFKVGARVEESCAVSAPDLASRRAAQQLRATCTPDATYLVGANLRKASPGAQAASYLTGVGTGEPVDHTLFGGVPASQVVPPADYTDTVSVRVYY